MKAITVLIVAVVALLFQADTTFGQGNTPAKAQSERIILMGGVAHIGNGEVIENSAICFENGKILWVEDVNRVKIDPSGAKMVQISGKHVYPGIIAPNTVIGLREIEAVRATSDYDETGGMNPNVRSSISYNTDSRVTPTVRSNGILIAQVAPEGGRISGTSSIMQLDAWNWEDALLKEDDGIFVNWASMFTYKGWWAEPGRTEINKKYEQQVSDLVAFFREAKAYAAQPNPEKRNLKFDAMKGLFEREKKLYVRVNKAREILAVIDFVEEMGVDAVIVGGRDSWMLAEELAEAGIPVILGNLHSLPPYHESDIDQVYKTPKLLRDAGVQFCLSMNGFWNVRNLMFTAGNAVSYGLTKEEALASITSSTSEILGIDDRVGTLEAGKDATLIVSTADVLDMRTSMIEHAFINGREIDLNNKQKMLYEKFRGKYVD